MIMQALSEIELLGRIGGGDEDALMILHSRYVNLVFSVAYRVLNDQMSAEEVAQDTFMRIWNKSYTFDASKGSFVTWLLTVTRRLAIDLLRHQRRRLPQEGMIYMDENPQLWEEAFSTDGVGNELRRNLTAVMHTLPNEQRDLIELVYFYGLTHSDISETLGIPLGTVKTRIRLGMQKLRQAWLGDLPTSDNLTGAALPS
jgi:RNA polymerase sigma-70 factor (ECF subfamily)